jgi:Holliday junction resolvasome RuvABC endonuclease subunit
MRVLGIDPGTERMGWASVGRSVSDDVPYYHLSGVIPMPRGEEKFQEYRMEMAATLVYWTPTLIELTQPEAVVSEIVPSRGAAINEQLYLANVAVSTIHAVAMSRGIPCYQISARTVQSKIAIHGKSKKITKPQVRNGVIKLLPELEARKSDWIKIFEEPDAIAMALVYMGFTNA